MQQDVKGRYNAVANNGTATVTVTQNIHNHSNFHARRSYDIEHLLSYYGQFFSGRQTELQRLTSFMRQQQPGYLLIEADPGYGKSALLAAFIQQQRK